MKAWNVATSSAVAFGLALVAPGSVFAHCDSLDGPVVKAAQQALDTRDLARVLIWVRADDEPEVRAAFEETLTVRGLNSSARELADRYFFETVVRVHRAGEGASYTGLKPAGRDLGPAIPAADKALDEGSVAPLVQLVMKAAEEGLSATFEKAVAAKSFRLGDVKAGRAYITAYVEFVHYVERLYEAAARPAHGHFPETEPRH